MEMRICTEEGLKAIEVGENVKLCVLYFRLGNVRSTSDLLVIKCQWGVNSFKRIISKSRRCVVVFYSIEEKRGLGLGGKLLLLLLSW